MRVRALLLPAIAASVLSCAEIARPVANVNFVSIDQERELGRQFAQEVEKKQPVVQDRVVADYVSEVGRRLSGTIREPEFTYRFQAVKDPTVNAFNIGGGYVFVHTGLIAAADTEAQVASVLAHEIGHQIHRHVAKMISRQQLFQTLATAAIGANASQWVQLAASLGITTGQMHFSREAERQADDVMVVLMTRAGYDPREALAMFQKLRALDGQQPGRVAALFSSHPATSERIEDVRRHIQRMQLPQNLVRDTKRFHEVRQRVAGG